MLDLLLHRLRRQADRLLGRCVTGTDVAARVEVEGQGPVGVLVGLVRGDDLLRLGGAGRVVQQHVDLGHLVRHPGVRLALVDLQVLGPGVGGLAQGRVGVSR